MSKIRIYDLAKEAGIKSTELAEKLIDLGYNIKGHSSSVEDEVADEIRRNVLGTVETEVVEKRISTKGRATIIRRRSQTVRRAAETVPPVEEVVARNLLKKKKKLKSLLKNRQKRSQRRKRKKMWLLKTLHQSRRQRILKRQLNLKLSSLRLKLSLSRNLRNNNLKMLRRIEEKKPEPKTNKRIVPPRQGLARVIKKAAIQIPEEKPKAPARPPRPPRPAKGKARVALVAAGPDIKAGEAKSAEDARAGKGKKKGKRLVQFRSGTEDQAGRLKKGLDGKRKGRKGFGTDRDYEYGPRGARGPKAKKKKAGAGNSSCRDQGH